MIKSMTGFGKGDSQIGDKYFQVELKSVNHRYMDVSIRLPKMFTYLEENIRNFIKSYLQRGRIEVYIVYKNMGDSDVKVTIDMPLAKEYLNSLTKMDWELAIQSDITTSLIVGFPDVLKVERKEEDEEETWQCLQKALDTALMELIAMRKEEGEKLKIDMLKRLDKIDGLLAQIRDRSPIIIQEYRQKLTDRIKEILDEQLDLDEGLCNRISHFTRRIITDKTNRVYRLPGWAGRYQNFYTLEVSVWFNCGYYKFYDFICIRQPARPGISARQAPGSGLYKQISQ